MIRITSEPICTQGAYQLLERDGAGSVVLHYAVVKAQEGTGGTTCHIEYHAAGDAEAELSLIARELCQSFTLSDVALIRRCGLVPVGEVISLVAASSPNSEDAFEACRAGIARLKKMKSIRKNEVCA